jgi:pectate lyase
MIITFRSKQKVAIASILLSALIFSSSCKKDSDTVATKQDSVAFSATTISAAATTNAVTLRLTGLKSDGGYAYKLGYALSVSGDSNAESSASTLKLFENGVELKPGHAVHQDIRDSGKGRYSHWGTALYFSASDNTNPATNGRVYTYTLNGSAPTTVGSQPITSAPAPQNNDIVGYAMVNGSTTGGQGGQSVTVTTLDQLKSALGESAAKIVYVSGKISGSGDEAVYVKSNKSIIGKLGASIEGISLYLFTVNNVIIQDLTFKNYVSDAAVMVKFQTTHVWIDHCDFSTDKTHGWDYWGKDISITRGSDFVTVSWSKFHDTNLSVLIAGGLDADNVADDRGKLHVTMHHNYWYNITEREPSMCTGNVHMFNNYHSNNSGYSIGARASGTVRTDNEYFANCKTPITTRLNSDPAGYISGAETNIYSQCGANGISTAASSWLPPYSYSSALDAAANVPSIVQKGAGPRAIN